VQSVFRSPPRRARRTAHSQHLCAASPTETRSGLEGASHHNARYPNPGPPEAQTPRPGQAQPGLAYKANVDDDRESPSYEILKLLKEKGARVDYCDPLFPQDAQDAQARSRAAVGSNGTGDLLAI